MRIRKTFKIANKPAKKLASFVIALFMLTLLMGCGATHTIIKKRNLDVQTKMSDSVFLDPVAEAQRTIYVQARNTSDKPELDLTEALNEAMIDKGYQLVPNPELAHYILQANVLQVGRCDLRETEHALNKGFGAAMGGAFLGATLGGSIAKQNAQTRKNAKSKKKQEEKSVVGALLGAGVATAADAMIDDVVYSVIADVQVSERVGNSIVVKEKTRTKLQQGLHGAIDVTSTEKVAWKRYQTRVVSTANKVNLKFQHAAPMLVQGLTRSITGIF